MGRIFIEVLLFQGQGKFAVLYLLHSQPLCKREIFTWVDRKFSSAGKTKAIEYWRSM